MSEFNPTLTQEFLPPPGEVFPIACLRMEVEEGEHSLWLSYRSEIEANWELEVAANPHLFNGQVLLQERIALDGDVLVTTGKMTSYSTLLWWRKQPNWEQIRLLFGAAVPVSGDGRIIVVRMAPHTANAGRICLAAGSLDAADIHGKECDVIGSMNRELKEETGLDIKDATIEEQIYSAHSNGRCIAFRPIYFPGTGEQIMRNIKKHMNSEALSEIDEVYAVEPGSWSALAPLMDDLTRLVVHSVFAKR